MEAQGVHVVKATEDAVASASSSEVTVKVCNASGSTTSTSANDQVNGESSSSRKPPSTADEKKTNGSDDRAGTSSTASKTREVEVGRARKNFEYGKHLLFFESEYERGADVLKSACSEYCNLYDPLGQECGEVLMMYGLSLLLLRRERARMKRLKDSDLDAEECAKWEEIEKSHELDEIDDDDDDDDDDDEDDDEEEEEEEEAATANYQPEKKVSEEEIGGVNSLKKKFVTRCHDPSNNASSEANNGDVAGVSGEESEADKVDREREREKEKRMRVVDEYYLVHAILKIFKIASKIFTKSKDYEHLAYVISKIGEVAVDLCDFKAAVDNFKMSLEILEKLAPDGLLFQKVTLHYQLFLAYVKDCHFGEAEVELIETLTMASEYLLKQREKLNSLYRAEDDEVEPLTEEISEIEELIKVMTKKAGEFPAERVTIQKYNKEVQKLVTSDYLSELFSVMSLMNESTQLRGDQSPEPNLDMQTRIVWPKLNRFEEKDKLIYSLIEKIEAIIKKPKNEDDLLRRCKRKIDFDNGGSDQVVLKVKMKCLS